ncbi:hypothetical protein EDD94_5071 [Streptomyces sp. PanSC9]|nr:hypothetical protein EDD94_5071 [Streptomyces sp. PanSC9]
MLSVHGQEWGRKLTFPAACRDAGRDLTARLTVTAG